MSKKKKIAISLILVTLIVLSFIGGLVFAKYQTQVKGTGQADVAKWAFNVNGNSSIIQTISLASTYDEEKLVNGKIAPGTKGSFNIVADATGSEVGVEYNVSFLNETNKPTNLKFIYDDKEYSSIDELEDVLTGVIDANDPEKSKNMIVSWVWDYETGNDLEQIRTNDVVDTNEGVQNLNYTFDIVVTGTQVQPQA